MDSDSSITTNTSTSSHAISGGATKTRKEVNPSIVVDLTTCEHCDVETLLDVLLKRCRDSPAPSELTPSTDLNPSTPQLPSTDYSPDSPPDGSPSSTATVRASSGPAQNPSAPNPNSEDSPASPPAQPQLLQDCLQAVLSLCQDEVLLQHLTELKISGKEQKRYVPLTKFLNHALRLLAPLSLPGIRAASDLQVLFVVNDPKMVHWRPGAVRSPDLILLSLAATRQIYKKLGGDWDNIAEACLTGSRDARLEFPDVLVPVEVKWNDNPIDSEPPATYGTRLGVPIGQLTADGEQVGSAGTISSDTTPASTPTSVPSSDSGRSLGNVGDSTAASSRPRLPKRSGAHLASDDSEPKKQKQSHHDKKHTRIEAVTQSGGSAAEMLYCSLGRRHAFGLVIIDATSWVWWYDRQGAIQSTGIDFIHNLPHFLVLLFVLQRFTLADWGFDTELDPSIFLRHDPQHTSSCRPTTDASTSDPLESSTSRNGGSSINSNQRSVSADNQRGRPSSTNGRRGSWTNNSPQRSSSAGGRGRGVANGSRGRSPNKGKRHSSSNSKEDPPSESQRPSTRVQATTEFAVNSSLKIRYQVPMQTPLHAPFCPKGRSTTGFGVTDASDATDTLGDSPTPFVAKLYWPHRDRLKEEEIIKKACGVATDLHNHLPFVAGARDIDPLGTLRIRQELGIDKNSPCPPRALRMIVFESLTPITDLQGDAFLMALVECMRCHFILWNEGLLHQDVTLANLMVRIKGGHYFGVLNDWDLSYSEGQSESDKDLTATVPYVAIHLLQKRWINPKFGRLYYHELESFFWSMIWMFLAYSNKNFQPLPNVVPWQTADKLKSARDRFFFLGFPEAFSPYEEWGTYRETAESAIEWVRDHCREPDLEETADKNLVLLGSFLKIIGVKLQGNMPSRPAVVGL